VWRSARDIFDAVVRQNALTREAETLRQDLLHVPGVKKVNVFGERPERIFVQFTELQLWE
jgi:multidrug efflux pump subunit AcrB